MDLQMLGTHRRTYEAVFQHPVPRDLAWRDVHAMLAALADEEVARDGHLRFTRNGQSLSVRPQTRKDFSDVDAVMAVRGFLDRSGAGTTDGVADGMHLLVVIDHREARVYRTELRGAVPERVTPYSPSGAAAGRYLHDVTPGGDGRRRPEPKAFFDEVAKALAGAEQVLIFGSGTGSSSAMDQLAAELQRSHRDLARRVVGAVVIDEQHLTEGQLLAKARAFYGNGMRHF
jgi:hypothetical protein